LFLLLVSLSPEDDPTSAPDPEAGSTDPTSESVRDNAVGSEEEKETKPPEPRTPTPATPTAETLDTSPGLLSGPLDGEEALE
jgi:hypothetical protein